MDNHTRGMTTLDGKDLPATIVLIDDAPDLRELVRLALESSGAFAVTGEGGSGRDAVALARSQRPALMLLDVSMPDMDGLEAIKEIRGVSPGTCIAVFSGFQAAGLAERARELGAADFIEKSVLVTELPRRLLALLAGVPPGSRPADAEPPASSAGEQDPVLAEHMERFRTAFEGASIGMAALTLTGRIVRVNDAFAELLHRPEAACVGQRFTDLVDDASQREMSGVLHRAMAAPRAVSVEHGVASDPGLRVRSVLSPVRDAQNRTLYLFLQVLDITTETETQRRLLETERRFRLLVETVSDYAIFMLDPTGRIVTWNAGAQKLKGYRADEIIGQHFRVFYTPEAQARRHPEHELEVAVRDGRYEEEGWRVRKDGSHFWALVVITALFDESGQLVGFGKVTRDNTERHAITEERERATQALEAANARLKVAADEKAEFVAVTAHELRGPVQLMRGSAETLLDDWDRLDEPTRKRLLQLLAGAGNRLHRLLEDLLVVARAEAGRLDLRIDTVPLCPLLHDVAHEVDGGGGITVDCDDDIAVSADRVRVQQIVTNLLANAMTYGAPPVGVAAAREGDQVTVTVTDHGRGIAESEVPKLFTKFGSMASSSGKGTGLGLYIVSQLAQAHGGGIEYRPQPEGGACFTVYLPAAPSGSRPAGV